MDKEVELYQMFELCIHFLFIFIHTKSMLSEISPQFYKQIICFDFINEFLLWVIEIQKKIIITHGNDQKAKKLTLALESASWDTRPRCEPTSRESDDSPSSLSYNRWSRAGWPGYFFLRESEGSADAKKIRVEHFN